MIEHEDWNQYKHVLEQLNLAKRKVQEVLKPGGGGPTSTNIGEILDSLYILVLLFVSWCHLGFDFCPYL